MRRIIIYCIITLMLFNIVIPFSAFAVGDGNIDSGGGNMGSGTSQNKWSPGNDGVRVSIINTNDYSVIGSPDRKSVV